MCDDKFKVMVLVKKVPFKYISGELTYWNVDPEKWSYFKVVGALKDVSYIELKELFYCIETMFHKLHDDKGAMNMINMAKYYR